MMSEMDPPSTSSGRLTTADFFPEFQHDRLKSARVSRRNFSVLRTLAVVGLSLFVFFVPSWLFINLNWKRVLETEDKSSLTIGTCSVMEGLHINCFPELNLDVIIDENACFQRGCCFRGRRIDEETVITECFHSLPSSHTLNVSSESEDNYNLVNSFPNEAAFWSQESNEKSLSVDWIDEQHLLLEFGLSKDSKMEKRAKSKDNNDISITLLRDNDARLRLQVNRLMNNTQYELFDASLGPLILSDALSELTLLLGSNIVFGLPGLEKKIWYNDTLNVASSKTYYSLPDTLATTAVGLVAADASLENFFGLAISTTSPLRVEALEGLKKENATNRAMINLMSMGGDIKLYVFVGPDPLDVLSALNSFFRIEDDNEADFDYNEHQWIMGHTVCPATTSDFNELLVSLMNNASLPFDSACLSEQLVKTLFDTPSEMDKIRATVDELKKANKKFVLAIPPYVSVTSDAYHTAQPDFFVQFGNESRHFEAMINGKTVVYPDYNHKHDAFVNWLKTNFWDSIKDLKPEGLVLVHNAPLVENPLQQCTLNYTFVHPHIVDEMTQNSICPEAKHPLHSDQKHLLVHNEYAKNQVNALIKATNLPIVASDSMSTNMERGSVARVHEATWQGLRNSLEDAIDLGTAGRSLVAIAGCGNGNEQDDNNQELCLRWYQLASLMPGGLVSLNANHLPHVLSAYSNWVSMALRQRYRLTPYFRLIHRLNVQLGQPMMAPLVLHFPKDDEARDTGLEQFMLGQALMVLPVLDANEDEEGYNNVMLDVYLPEKEQWFDLWSGQSADSGWQRVPDVPYQTRIFARAGNVIPALEWASSSILDSLHMYNVSIIAALHCSPSNCRAQGQMVLDSTTITSFSAESDDNSGFLEQMENFDSCKAVIVDSLLVYGLDERPDSVVVMDGDPLEVGQSVEDVVYFDDDAKRLHARDLGINICSGQRLTFKWFYDNDDSSGDDEEGSGEEEEGTGI